MGLLQENKVINEEEKEIVIELVTEKPLLKDTQPEMNGIVSSICKKYVENLLTLIITTGPPGMGKSYADLRMAEEVRTRLGFKDIYGGIKFVRKKSELSQVFLEGKSGDCIIVEEGSYMINSKRSMSSENVESGIDIDTIRKKGLIVWVNLPLQKSLDSHWRDMASHLVEMQRIDKTNGFSVAKCFEVNFNKFYNKSIPNYIKAKFKTDSGRIVLRKVKETWFGKPLNGDLIDKYEQVKVEHMDMILTKNFMKAKQREEKENQKLYGVQLKPNVSKEKHLDRDLKVVELRNKGMTYQEIGKVVGTSLPNVQRILKKSQAKEGK